MSMNDYLKAVKLIRDSGEGDFEGKKPDSLIEAAEQCVNVKFPPTYRLFLKDLGCGDIGGEEFYGIINEDFRDSAVPDGIWLTLSEREKIGLSEEFVVVYSAGDGIYYALDTSRTDDKGEYPIVALSPEGKKIEDISTDFGKFFWDKINQLV